MFLTQEFACLWLDSQQFLVIPLGCQLFGRFPIYALSEPSCLACHSLRTSGHYFSAIRDFVSERHTSFAKHRRNDNVAFSQRFKERPPNFRFVIFANAAELGINFRGVS